MLDGANLAERVQTQITRAQDQAKELDKQADAIAVHIAAFTQLNQLIKKPEVDIDYRDLNYVGQLDFVPEMEQSLEAVRQLINDSKRLVEDYSAELQAIIQKPETKDGDTMELDLLLEKIRGTAEFRSVREQKAEVEQALQKLKTKRQNLGDCSVRANIKLRGNELKLLAENLDSTETKY